MFRLSIVLLVAVTVPTISCYESKEISQDTNIYAPIEQDSQIPCEVPDSEVQYIEGHDKDDDSFSISISEGVLSLAYELAYYVASKVAAFIFGSISVLAVCKLTPICTTIQSKCTSLKGFKSLVTPENINIASRIVQKAIDKYTQLNKIK